MGNTMKLLIIFLSLFLYMSCLSNKVATEKFEREEFVNRKNAKIGGTNEFEYVKFWMELDVFRLKYNIVKINFGIIFENFEDSVSNQSDPKIMKSLNDRSYKFIVDIIKDMNNIFEEEKINYFSYSDKDKSGFYDHKKYFTNVKSDSNDVFYKYYEDLQKRLRYYSKISSFFTSQSAFENYLKERSHTAVDRSSLKNILGEYGLSQTGVTKEQAAQLKLHNINFLIIASDSYYTKYENEISDYIAYHILDIKLIYAVTSEIVTTYRLVKYY